MKFVSIFSIALLMFAMTCYAGSPELRSWTGSNGSTLQATFVSESPEQVVLLSRDGRNIYTKRLNLSQGDREYLDSIKTNLVVNKSSLLTQPNVAIAVADKPTKLISQVRVPISTGLPGVRRSQWDLRQAQWEQEQRDRLIAPSLRRQSHVPLSQWEQEQQDKLIKPSIR